MAKKTVRMYVGLPLSQFKTMESVFRLQKLIDKELEKLGAEVTGSGMGFGYRDMDYDVKGTSLEAVVAKVVEVIKAKGLKVDVNPMKEEDTSDDHAYVSY